MSWPSSDLVDRLASQSRPTTRYTALRLSTHHGSWKADIWSSDHAIRSIDRWAEAGCRAPGCRHRETSRYIFALGSWPCGRGARYAIAVVPPAASEASSKTIRYGRSRPGMANTLG